MIVQARSNPKMLTGFGQRDSHAVTLSDGRLNTSQYAGKPYQTVSWQDIERLVEVPLGKPKSGSQFVVLSSYNGPDGRCHHVQRERGTFHGLAADIDHGNKTEQEVVSAVLATVGACRTFVYSSSSATPQERKWRILVPLGELIAGCDYQDTQLAFFALMAAHGIACDDKLKGEGQLIYLPNVPADRRGDDNKPIFYVGRCIDGPELVLTDDHPIVLKREMARRDKKSRFQPTPSSLAHAGKSAAEIMARAERYVDAMPAAIEGHRGHDATYAAATALVNGFGLDEPTALDILHRRYNPRCEPLWSDRELRHKVRDAATKPHDRPYRYLLAERPAGDTGDLQDTGAIGRPATCADVRRRDTWNDAGLGSRLAYEGRDCIAWVRDRRTWAAYDGRVWIDDKDALEAERLAKDIGRAIFREMVGTEEPPKALVWFAHGATSARSIAAAVKCARSEPTIITSAAAFDTDPEILNCANGILELRTMTLRAHDPAARMSKITRAAFDPTARCPAWERFIDEVTCGEDELAGFLQRVFGLGLTGDVSEQSLFIHHGIGANGKSLAFATMADVLGGYAGAVPADTFVHKLGERDRELTAARLVGKRLAYSSESNDGERLAEATVKALTGGDRTTARNLYCEAVEAAPTWSLHLLTNALPKVRGLDHAIWRRLMPIPWNRVFGNHEQRPRRELEAEFASEADGILAWLCRGYTDWRAGGLRPPAVVIDAQATYRRDSDPVARWLADPEAVVRDGATEAPVSDLYAAFAQWCGDEGVVTVSLTAFARGLDGAGIRPKRTAAARLRVGLRLVAAVEVGQ
jgi:putative DNA primase/helicase